jgi:hypothetical protein
MSGHYTNTLINFENRDIPAPRMESELIDSAPGFFLNVDLRLYFPGNFGFSDGRSHPNKAFLNNNIPKGTFGVKDLSFKDCVEFQDCFLFDGKFSPFENVGEFRDYYPRVLVGEIGGLINLSCKLVRSPNIYDGDIEDECADIFIYLLLFGRMLDIHDRKQVFSLISSRWNEPVALLRTEEEYYDCCMGMIEKADRFLGPKEEQCYNEQYFHDFFLSILQASHYITGCGWQQIINKFHNKAIQKYTNPNCFTFDGLYKGSFRININKLLVFIDSVGIPLPEKRINFLRRVEVAQSIYFPEPSSKKNTKASLKKNTKAATGANFNTALERWESGYCFPRRARPELCE